MTAFSEDDYRDLVERAQEIAETASSPGWGYLVDRVNVLRAKKQAGLVSGSAHTIEDYIREVAWLEGAEYVLSTPERVARELAAERERIAEGQAEEE